MDKFRVSLFSTEESVMKVGYLIRNAQGGYLSGHLFWYRHDSPEEAFVHPADSLGHVRTVLQGAKARLLPGATWYEPTTMIPATWTEGEGVVITGAAEPFQWE